MKKNVGSIDRVIRIVIGILLLSLLIILKGRIRLIGLIGILPIATALFSYCPLYAVVSRTSCPFKNRRRG